MKKDNEVNNNSTSKNTFSEVVEHGLKNGGVHLVSVKGHGKTRLLFNMARELRQKSRVIIFDGSETWLYAFDKIPTFTIKERDIVAKKVKRTDEIERYRIKNWNLVISALHSHKHILFRLKTRKPSKRGFFIRAKTIRTKQTYAIGKIPEEDKMVAIRRLERKYNVDFSKLKAREWCFEGKIFKSPNWKQKGKPYQINNAIKKEYIDQLKPQKKKGFVRRLVDILLIPARNASNTSQHEEEDQDEIEEEEDAILF